VAEYVGGKSFTTHAALNDAAMQSPAWLTASSALRALRCRCWSGAGPWRIARCWYPHRSVLQFAGCRNPTCGYVSYGKRGLSTGPRRLKTLAWT
jgi:hypothetical protein